MKLRRQRHESSAKWNSYGYRNFWGGFHMNTDWNAYAGLFGSLFSKPYSLKVKRYILHLLHWRWIHRSCDTVDFHHYACLKDPFGRLLDADYSWEKNWRSHPNAIRAREETKGYSPIVGVFVNESTGTERLSDD